MHYVQDGVLELRILPHTLRSVLPPDTNIREAVDFAHLVGDLYDVADACERPAIPTT